MRPFVISSIANLDDVALEGDGENSPVRFSPSVTWKDDGMDVSSLVAAALCAVVALALLVLSVWFRWGGSRAARWWVRRHPVDRASFASSAPEALALGVLPYLAQLMAAVALVAMVHVAPAVREVLFSPMMWTVVIGELILGIAVLVPLSNRRILPLFVYPGWLRPLRRDEREWLRTHER